MYVTKRKSSSCTVCAISHWRRRQLEGKRWWFEKEHGWMLQVWLWFYQDCENIASCSFSCKIITVTEWHLLSLVLSAITLCCDTNSADNECSSGCLSSLVSGFRQWRVSISLSFLLLRKTSLLKGMYGMNFNCPSKIQEKVLLIWLADS